MSPADAPSLGRRLLCALYDGVLLSAVLFVAAFPFVALSSALAPTLAKPLLQFYLLLVAGAYFTLFWHKGQTLAMKTWKLRLESREGGLPSWGQAWLRYALAGANIATLGLGWWSALLRADRQFLQDHWAGTRLRKTP